MPSIAEATFLGLLAGLVTVVGGAIGTSIKRSSDKTLSAIFGFTAGTMLTVTFVNIIPRSTEAKHDHGSRGFCVGCDMPDDR
jgi:ZIP family zinc transporter